VVERDRGVDPVDNDPGSDLLGSVVLHTQTIPVTLDLVLKKIARSTAISMSLWRG